MLIFDNDIENINELYVFRSEYILCDFVVLMKRHEHPAFISFESLKFLFVRIVSLNF